MNQPAQPFLLKDGDNTVFEGSRSDCLTEMTKQNGNLEIVPNLEYPWIGEEK